MQDTPLNDLIKKYYPAILKYCVYQLRSDYHGAEDCTQEVFYLLVQKHRSLDFSKDIRPWLYAAADRIIHNYRRKYPATEDIEIVQEKTEDFQYPESVLDILNNDEKQLIMAYINGVDRNELAKKNNLSIAALYKRIARIKKKIQESKYEP